MWVYLFVVLAFLAGCSGCKAPQPIPVTVNAAPVPRRDLPPLPYNTALIHVDVDFTETERAHIRNALTAWSLFTMGRVTLRAEEDLDFNQEEAFQPSHRIVKVFSHGTALVDMVDAQHPGYKTLAFTMVNPKNAWAPRAIYVVADRFTEDRLHWIVVHELGHFLGLDDLDEMGSVMSGVGRFTGTWFTPSDLRECQAALVCK
jgi:UDP-N-acetylglucosamine enolpyruvyl transferase